MESYFFLSTNVTNLVFYSLTTHDSAELAGVCILFGALTFILEGLLIWREYVAHAVVYYTTSIARYRKHNRYNQSTAAQSALSIDTSHSSPPSRDFAASDDLQNIPAGIGQLKVFQWEKSLLATIGHMLYFFVSYVIMLAVMSYNAYIILSVVLASGLSYFLCRVWYIEFEKEIIPPVVQSVSTIETNVA